MAILPVDPRKHFKELILALSRPGAATKLQELDPNDAVFGTWATSLQDSHFFEVEMNLNDETQPKVERFDAELVKIPFKFFVPFWNCVYYFPNEVRIAAKGTEREWEFLGFNIRELGVKDDDGSQLRNAWFYQLHLFFFDRKETARDSQYGSGEVQFLYNRETQEIMFRKEDSVAMRETAYLTLTVVNKVNTPSPIKEVEVHNVRENNISEVVHQSSPRSIGVYKNISEALVINLDKVRYKYKGKSEHGKGSEHRVQYDVRRHMRIRNNHIEWVSPHRRGKGEYQQKIYKKGVSVSWAWGTVERLSTNKYIEPILVRFIKFLRRVL